jgi:hypothetical protein
MNVRRRIHHGGHGEKITNRRQCTYQQGEALRGTETLVESAYGASQHLHQ